MGSERKFKLYLTFDEMTEVLCDEYGISIGDAAINVRSDLDIFGDIGYHQDIRTKEEYRDYLKWLEGCAE